MSCIKIQKNTPRYISEGVFFYLLKKAFGFEQCPCSALARLSPAKNKALCIEKQVVDTPTSPQHFDIWDDRVPTLSFGILCFFLTSIARQMCFNKVLLQQKSLTLVENRI